MSATDPPQGLRFVHPDLDDEAAVGLVCGEHGHLESAAGAALIRQSLLLLLSTTPGERVMRPDYGCALLSLAFSLNDDTTAGLAIHFVREAVTRFEPRARILDVSATRPADAPHALQVRLDYQPRWGGTPDTLTVWLPLDGPAPEY